MVTARLTLMVRRWSRQGGRFYACSALLLMWLVAAAGAQVVFSGEPTCCIEVNVEDDQGDSLARVAVTAIAPGLAEARTMQTDTRGRVELIGLVAGVYRLELDLIGYQWLEVEKVHCPPEAAVRLWLQLEAVAQDEIVIVPSGPMVDVESVGVGWWLDREDLEPLPPVIVGAAEEPVVADSAIESGLGFGLPTAGRQWQGLYLAGSGVGEEAPTRVVFRIPPALWHGEAGIEAGRGVGAVPTGTRGSVSTLSSTARAFLSIGGGFSSDRARLFVALEAGGARTSNEAEFGASNSAAVVDQHQSSDRRDALGFASLRWQPAASNSLDVRLRGVMVDDGPAASTLFVTSPSSLPLFDRRLSGGTAVAGWSAMESDTIRLWVELGAGRQNLRVRPESANLIAQDQTSDGSMSGGFGNGIWEGAGGIAQIDDAQRLLGIGSGLEWAAGDGHRLTTELVWNEERRETSMDPASRGRRLYWLAGGGSRLDELSGSSPATGTLRRGSLFVHDVWRAGRDLTLVFRLGLEDSQFSGGEGRDGYHLGFRDTAAFGLGAVWDFEGRGRSRLWVQWSRSRPELDEVTHLRLSGALDVNTVFGLGGGLGDEVRPPGSVRVAPAMAPALDDDVTFGAEYEVLSHVAVGLAGTHRRISGGVATLSEDGGRSFVVGTPSGPSWEHDLESKRWSASAWARKRLANAWQAAVTLQWSQARGTWSGSAVSEYSEVDREYLRDVIVPEALVNSWGPLQNDREWRVEVLGSWTLSAGPVLGARVGYASGAPVSMLGALAGGFGLDRRFVEGRGSAGRTPELWRTDVVCSWPFEVGSGVLLARAEIRNLLNRQAAISVDERWTLLDQIQATGLDPEVQRTPGTWGAPLETQKPLEARIGVSYRW